MLHSAADFHSLFLAGVQPRLKSGGGPMPGWVLTAGGGGSPPPAVRVWGYHVLPGKFVKTQMLSPAFW